MKSRKGLTVRAVILVTCRFDARVYERSHDNCVKLTSCKAKRFGLGDCDMIALSFRKQWLVANFTLGQSCAFLLHIICDFFSGGSYQP